LSLWGTAEAGADVRDELLGEALVGLAVSVPDGPAGAEAVTMSRILLISLSETPAFFRSSTEEYGRFEIIFFAVADPTPGRAVSSLSDAVFRSTLVDVVCCG
jgi:hypothetical protein